MQKAPKSSEPKATPPPASALFESLQADYATIRVVIITTLAFIAVLAVPLVWITKSLVTAKAVDDMLGLSTHVKSSVGDSLFKRVDSGYSRSFVLSGAAPTRDTDFLFFSEPDQTVKIVADGVVSDGTAAIRILIDNERWIERELPFQTQMVNISKRIRNDTESGDIHVVKVVPVNLGKRTTAVVRCLVLVSNR